MKSLYLKSFNTNKTTDMQGVFSGCSSLTTFDLSTLDTQNVENMKSMLENWMEVDYVKFYKERVFQKGKCLF